jgi:hypothetical protein
LKDIFMITRRNIFAALLGALVVGIADAKGGGSHGGGGRSHSGGKASRGTGASTKSHKVRTYRKKNGKVVQQHRQSDRNGTANDNWSTKGNRNPDTGKSGSK